MSIESEHLIRLGNVLAERNAGTGRVLSAVEAARTDNVFLGFAALSSRVELMLPLHAAVLETIAPGVELPDPPPARGVIRASADGDQVAAGVVTIGSASAQAAVDELVPDVAGKRWLQIVEPLIAAGGQIMNRTLFLTDERAVISVSFAARSGDGEDRFVRAIDDHHARIGLSEAHRALWKQLYPVSGTGRVLSVTTECTGTGPTAHFGVLNDNMKFDQAIDLLKVMVDPVQARNAAAGLGLLSGTLQVDRLMGSEIVLGGEHPELVVWLPPRQA